MGSIATPNQPTFYKYNPQGKMVKVSQGVQNRYFLYDYLGRLIRVRQPEQEVNPALDLVDLVSGNNQWTAAMEYDLVGNLIKTTDAENKQITNSYDKAGRVKVRSYSNLDTPSVYYYYDGMGLSTPPSATNNFAKGKLTKVSSSISATQFTSFDNFGRTLASQQITDGNTYESKYKFDFGGRMVEQTYPSGKVVRNFFESDGDLARITGQGKTYASDFAYTATGSYDRLKLGNGRWESWKYNSRLQLTEIALGTQPTDGSLWKQNYEFGEVDANGNVNTSKNTGNIAKLTNSFNGLAQPFVQTFQYDSLNRITAAKEINNGTTTWQQGWNYDRFGNRTAFNSQAIGQTTITTTPNIDQNTNRFVSGVQYDKTGNIVQDSVNGQLRNFVFNGDNKQVHVKDANNQPIGTYFYDGNGARVKKSTASETTIFVYDAGGLLVAEYSTATPTQTPTVSYTATDTLGSPRVITDKQGNVTSRRDFLPFGEELNPDVSFRKTEFKYGYGSDSVRKRFTGYEKDQETQLDYAQARYYNNKHGRFTAVDPLLASGKSGNPQSFNRYAYTMNQPLTMIDPTGLQTQTVTSVESLGNVTTNISLAPATTRNNYCYAGNCVRGESFGGFVEVSNPAAFARFGNGPQPIKPMTTEDWRNLDVGLGIGIRNTSKGWIDPTNKSIFTLIPGLPDTSLNAFGVKSPFNYEVPENNAQFGASVISSAGTNLLGAWAGGRVLGFGLRQNAISRANSAFESVFNANSRVAGVVCVADTTSNLSIGATTGAPPTIVGPRMQFFADRLGGIGTRTPCGNVVGACAEFRGANALELQGANPRNLVFTPTVRPRTGQILPVCENCQTMFSPSQFPRP